ncbi:MAG: Ni/Fe hydrogenase subunit alpha [Desulfobacterales bacterium]|nr:Ni/Fe hydrogenase subunit alpha [Desulfobacterales bacterium]
MTKQITINPITRLEGHGKIEIFLNDQGDVDQAFWQVVELRGFETFCLGRPAEEMTRIVGNICGVCPSAHHMASTKALDQVFGVEPTATAKIIRQLEFNAFYIEDHYIHFFFLAAPDFVLGPDADPSIRNILGLIDKVGKEIGSKVIEVRKRNRQIIKHLFSKAPHPEGGLPGGVPRGFTEQDRIWVKETADYSVEFAKFALQLFKTVVLSNKQYEQLIFNDAYKLNTHYMALVDENHQVNFYEGKVKVIDSKGNTYAFFDPEDYIKYIGEWVEPWTYVKLTHLRPMGWQGLQDGPQSSLYTVGPLAKLNVADRMATPLAQEAYEEMYETLGEKPAHNILAMHWARLICALQAAEHNQQLANDPYLTSKDIRNMNLRLKKEGVGCVEAPRGTLFHHYKTDDAGMLTMVNLIVATQHNAAPICLSVKKAAQAFIKGSEVKEGLLNMVEMAFRAYDPCLACATHAVNGRIPLVVNIRNPQGNILHQLQNT